MSSQNTWWGKTLRILGIVLMSLTAAFTIMGGAGTTCVALNPTGFGGKFSGIAPFQWLYLLFVIVTLAIGIWGVRAVLKLVRGARRSYAQVLLVLGAGILVGALHMLASRLLRGSSMPVDMVVYTTVFTLLVFLLFRFPGVWQGLDFEKPRPASGPTRHATSIALAATGVLTLIIQFLMAPTHTIGGVNYADVWHATLSVLGMALILSGMLWGLRLRARSRQGAAASEFTTLRIFSGTRLTSRTT